MVKSSALKILTAKIGYDLYFSYELLNNSKIENLGHKRHYISIVQDTEVLCPDFEEQRKISSLFQNLDNLISLHQRKLYKLQEIKKALLQKMFC